LWLRSVVSANTRNLTLFSFTGQALPSVGLFESPLHTCVAYDPAAIPCEVPDGASTGRTSAEER
jgi:hypothetical protein